MSVRGVSSRRNQQLSKKTLAFFFTKIPHLARHDGGFIVAKKEAAGPRLLKFYDHFTLVFPFKEIQKSLGDIVKSFSDRFGIF